MARSEAVAGKLSTLSVVGLSDQETRKIAEIRDLAWNGRALDLIDVTNMDSDGGWREFIAGYMDGGELTLALNFTRDEYEEFIDGMEDDTPKTYELALPSGDVFTLSGFVVNADVIMDLGEQVICRTEIKVTGRLTEEPVPTGWLYDAFTDTDSTLLSDHSPDIGDPLSWVYLPGGFVCSILGNTLTSDGNSAEYRNSTAPTQADYSVQARIHNLNTGEGNTAGCAIGARWAGPGNLGGYHVTLTDFIGVHYIQLYVGASGGPASVIPRIPYGSYSTVKLEVVGNDITVSVDDVEYLNLTDNTYPDAGNVFLYVDAVNSLDELKADYV